MRTWLKWLLGIVGGIFGVLLLAIGGLALFFDWNWLRDPATNFASEKTGRSIKLTDLQGQWSLRPTVRLQDVHIANAEWAEAEEFFSAELIEVQLDLPELLRGRTVIPHVRLVNPDIALEMREDGTANWNLVGSEHADAAPDERSEVPLIGRFAIEGGRIRYKDPKRKLDLDGKLSTAEVKGGEGKSEVRLEGNGTLQGEKFQIKATGGSLLSLRENEEPYPLKIEIEAVDSQATIAGMLDDPITFDGVDLKVQLKGPNLARLTKITGVPLPLTPQYDLQSRLERDGKVFNLTGIKGKMGNSDLSGRLKIDGSKERTYLEADLASNKLDYRDVGFLIGVKPGEEGEGMAKAEDEQGEGDRVENEDGKKAPKRVLPDAPLSVEQVRETDAKVRFKAKQVEAPNVPLSGVDLTLELKDGILHMKPLTVGVAGGTTIADIRIDARDEPIRTDYDIKLKAYELKEFLESAGQKNAGRGRIDGRVKLTGWGATVRDSVGNADGDIRLVINEGELSQLVVELVGLDIAESLGLLARNKTADMIPIRCMVADLAVQNGVISPRIFVLDTTDTTMMVEGPADFRTEQMDLAVKAYPKDPSVLALRTPITVKGSFAEPKVGIQKAPLAARGAIAVALGLVLTPFASLLAFIEPGMSADQDCVKLLERVQAPAEEKSPNKVETPK
jgi:AsmA family protein